MLIRVLLAIPSPDLRRRVAGLLPHQSVLVTESAAGLWEALQQGSFDLVVLATGGMPGAAAEVIPTVRRQQDRPDVVVLQERDDAEARAAMLAAGGLAVVGTDLSDRSLAQSLAALVNRRRETALSRLRGQGERHRLSDFATYSAPMQSLLSLARRVVASDNSLLIQGETGVGKEWLARAIHAEGPRAGSPFVAVNCAAVPDTLLESELFGHEKGAFPGANRSRRGYFELAHRGTIFLDEIADMTAHLQAKLLRVLQERRIQRLGSQGAIEVNVRIMAATNRDLQEAMESRTFRPDLYYRLGVVTLTLPPLRHRREDIPALVHGYLDHFRVQLRRPVMGIQPGALDALVRYPWPGNVRELINVLERAVLLCQDEQIDLADLPGNIATDRERPAASGADNELRLSIAAWADKPLRRVRREAVAAVERAYLSHILARSGGKVGEAARRAGLNPRSLYETMKRLGLRKEDFKDGRTGSPEE